MSIENSVSIDNSRRKFLQTSGLGIGWLAALDLFQRTGVCADTASPLAAKTPPLPATAKSVISLFMQGGPSQVDTYDPKPLLAKLHGQHPRTASARFPEREVSRYRDPRFEAELQKVRSIRNRSLRSFPAHVAVRGRSRNHTFVLPRGLHPFPGAVPDQQRMAADRAPQSRFVDPVRARHRESEPARIRGSAGRRGPLGPAVYGQGFCRLRSGTSFRPGRNPILNLTPPKEWNRISARSAGHLAKAERAASGCAQSRFGTGRAYRILRACLPHADVGSGGHRYQQRIGGHQEIVWPR